MNAALTAVSLAPALKPLRSASQLSAPWRSRSRSRCAGFSLIELCVVIFIISVMAALAVPTYMRIRTNARSAAVINDLRVFANAFQSYASDRGDWPTATTEPGVVPPGMQGYLSSTNWERTTPIGGLYTYAANTTQGGERYRAALIISTVGENKVTAEQRQLEDIDHKIDDGDLDTGNFRLGYRNQPVFVIEH